jgi:hypothetical protein
MKAKTVAWLLGPVLGLWGLSAQADLLLFEDWEGTVIQNATTISGDPLANLGAWYAFTSRTARWGTDTESCDAPCDGTYARHLVPPDGDQTNSLYYGIAGPVVAGTIIDLDFDYITSNRGGFVGLLGLTGGVSSLDPFAPFWYNGDGDDGEQLLADGTLAMTSRWANASFSTTLTSDYDALAFIVVMGGMTGTRGIDNITISTVDVPEPATLALFSIGLLGMGLSKRRVA